MGFPNNRSMRYETHAVVDVYMLPGHKEFTRDPVEAAEAWAAETWRLRDILAQAMALALDGKSESLFALLTADTP